MSRITKMKYVTADTIYDYSLPTFDQTICMITKSLGNSTFMVHTPTEEEFIVSMPRKFRCHVYVKRGSFVVTEPIIEGKKVKAEIVRILQRQQIKHFYSEGVWPTAFEKNVYLDNSHRTFEANSDRGFVHGNKVFYINKKNPDDLTSEALTLKTGNSSREDSREESDSSSSESDDESDLVPNYNKKAVSRIIFSDDSDTDDDESDEETSDEENSDCESEDKSDSEEECEKESKDETEHKAKN